jgi:hypothetical protein
MSKTGFDFCVSAHLQLRISTHHFQRGDLVARHLATSVWRALKRFSFPRFGAVDIRQWCALSQLAWSSLCFLMIGFQRAQQRSSNQTSFTSLSPSSNLIGRTDAERHRSTRS